MPDVMVVLGCRYEDAETAAADLAGFASDGGISPPAARDIAVTALAVEASGEPARLDGEIGSLADAVVDELT